MSKFSVQKRLESFKYAFNGIKIILRNEHNVWIHTAIATVVVLFGFWLQLSKSEWLFVIFAIGLVLISEGFNTAIEHLSDAVSESYNQKLKWAKDIGAGSVLLAAICSAIIGLLIFIPHLIEKLFGG